MALFELLPKDDVVGVVLMEKTVKDCFVLRCGFVENGPAQVEHPGEVLLPGFFKKETPCLLAGERVELENLDDHPHLFHQVLTQLGNK